MLLEIFSFVKSVFAPAAELIDEIHTSDEEKMKLQNVLAKIENDTTLKVIEYESKLLAAQTSIITAEANSASWIARNWRPITMLSFLCLVILDSFEWLPNPLANEAWTMLQIGLSGYVVGRSGEKIAKVMKS
jgi:hypothetical protein